MKMLKKPEDLAKLFDGLSRDLVDAHAYRALLKELDKALSPYPSPLHLAPTFWFMIQNSLQQTWGASLCRLFDTEPKSLSLTTLLKAISLHLEAFDDPAFRQRLSKNPHIENLASYRDLPTREQIQEDIQRCSPKVNVSVKKLIKIRSASIAHRGFALTVAAGERGGDEYLLEEEIDGLLSLAKEMVNTYSYMFDASTYATRIHGQDDFQRIIKTVRKELLEIEKEFEAMSDSDVGG